MLSTEKKQTGNKRNQNGVVHIDTHIDRTSPIPLYVQIKQRLLEYISFKRENPDESGPQRIFPEEDLAKMFNVSRMTIRQAIKELVDERVLYRVKGIGTFIAAPHVTGQLGQIERFVYEWSIQGKEIEVLVRDFDIVPLPDQWADWIRLPAGTPVLYLKRLRSADGKPVAFDDRYIPADLKDFITPEDVKTESIFITLAQKGNILIDRADYEIGAKAASPEEAELLAIRPGDPLLTRRLAIYDITFRPVVVGMSVYRADRFKYTVSVPSRT